MHPVVHIGSYMIKSYVLFNFILSAVATYGVIFWLSLTVFRDGFRLWKTLLVIAGGWLSAVVLARVTHYIVFYRVYKLLGLSVANPNPQGLILFSALIFSIPVVWLLSRLVGYPPYVVLDISSVGKCFSIFVAKIGCFLEGCCRGIPTNLPWGVTFPGTSQAVHPVQLYESAFGLVVGVVFFRLLWKRKLPDGCVFTLFAASYSLFRLGMFYLRKVPLGASYSEAAPFFFLALSFLFFMWFAKRLEAGGEQTKQQVRTAKRKQAKKEAAARA